MFKYYRIAWITVLVIGLDTYSVEQKKEPLVYFKWAGGDPAQPRLNVIARLQDPTTAKTLAEKTLQPGEAIMYNSIYPVNLYLKKDDFFTKLSANWTGPYTLEPNHPQYGRYADPNFEYIVDCDPSIAYCTSNKTSLAL